MDDMLYTAALPFKRKGTDTMKENAFIMALSMDLNWFKPDTARAFMQLAEENGLVSRGDGILKALFDVKGVQIPLGFKPDITKFEEKEVFDQIIERIMSKTGLDKKKIIANINQKRNETGGLFNIEVLGILVGKEYNVQMDDLIDKANINLKKVKN